MINTVIVNIAFLKCEFLDSTTIGPTAETT